VPDLRAAIEAERPDALVVDINCWGAQAAAEASGIPYALFSPYPLPLSSRDAPPFGPGFVPAHNAVGRLRDAVARPLVMGMIKRTNLPKVNTIRSGAGLAPLADLEEMFTRAPLMLYLSAEPFEYPRRDWPANVVMTGPMPWEPPAGAPAWLGDVRAPIVLVTTSSEFQDDGRLVAAALEGLALEPVFVVATVPAGDPATFPVPSNARVERFLPHDPILRRAAVAITHGGMGATQKARSLGVPVVAVPFGRDQPEVARRVEVARAGVRLPSGRLSPDRLRVAVREAMTMADGARRVAAGYAAAGGAPAAASAIETRLLAG
jgi:UDP:flavonoid glycosyltransferase YjiC (YdhE family)